MTNRILIIGNFLSDVTGTRSVCEDLSDRLEERGWQVVRTSKNVNRLRRLLDMVWTVLSKRNQYDCALVEVYSGNAFVWAEAVSYVLRLIRKPLVLTLHGGGLAEFARGRESRVMRLLQSATKVTTPSHYLQKAFEAYRADIVYLPNGLPIHVYPFRLRKKIAPDLVWLRAFHSIYNPLLAVQVIDRLQEDFPDIHLTMYGPDKGDGTLVKVMDYIAENGLQSCVTIFGAISKASVPASLAKYELFLNTTTFESFGVCVAEAAACGLPVVTTTVGELPYLYRDGQEALLVRDGDADAMAHAVRRLLTDQDLTEMLSGKARKVVEQFDWSTLLPLWENLLIKVTNLHR